MKINQFFWILAGLLTIVLLLIVWLIVGNLNLFEVPTQTAIFGALAAGSFGLVSTVVTFLGVALREAKDTEQRLKDRVSQHALDLTRMDYELRLKSIRTTKETRQFLAPVKVYRELYKALLELHETDEWPKTINELGLLSIFELGPDSESD